MTLQLKMKHILCLWLIGFMFSTLALKWDDKSNWKEDDCALKLREAKSVQVESRSPPNLSGHWTSSRCEIQPGPEFVLKKYLFRNKSFYAQMFCYADEDCSQVTHYFSAKGSIKPFQKSWTTPGGYEANYELYQVYIIPYTADKAKTFGKLMRRYCKQSRVHSVIPNKKFKIFQFTKHNKHSFQPSSIEEDFDCLKLFNYTLNELQLVRVEKRRGGRIKNKDTKGGDGTTEELLLGDVSTDMVFRRQYRPTYYQMPLFKAKTAGCDVCELVSNASRHQPPVLYKRNFIDIDIVGEWVSQRCETRPIGQYLTRHLSILADRKSWQGVYEFYNDHVCSQASFTLEAKGTYNENEKSSVIPSARNYVFKTMRLKITPQDFQMVATLNSDIEQPCGEPGSWRLGVTQDITDSKMCYALGIMLPHVEFELVRTTYDKRSRYLFVGQRPSDFASLSVAENRPTSFQSPLVHCSAKHPVFNEIVQKFAHFTANIVENESPSNTATSNSFVSWLFALELFCVLMLFHFHC